MKNIKCKDCKHCPEDKAKNNKVFECDVRGIKLLTPDYAWDCEYFEKRKTPLKTTTVFFGHAPNVEQNEAYLKAFDHFNKELFEDKLPRPMLTLSTNRNMIGGYFYPERWKDEDGNTVDEIAINSNLMETGDLVKLMNILIHEMVHLWHHHAIGKARNGYHSADYENKAKGIDLNVEFQGGDRQKCSTSLIKGGKAERAVATLDETALLPYMSVDIGTVDPTIVVQQPGGGGGKIKSEPSSTRKSGSRQKYTCPICGMNTWGKEGLNMLCLDCNEKLIGLAKAEPLKCTSQTWEIRRKKGD